jgi:hypothetical protein
MIPSKVYTAGRDNWISTWINVVNGVKEFNVAFAGRAAKVDLHTAASNTAQLIRADYNKPLYIAMSGGVDSEFVANTFLNEQIPFTPVILRIDKYNYPEYWFAEYWCQQNNVTPVYLDFTGPEFLTLVKKYITDGIVPRLYGYLTHLIVADHVNSIGGILVSGEGDPEFNEESKVFMCDEVDFITDIHRPGQHPTCFFMYTPEIALAYLDSFDVTKSERDNKFRMYGVPPRPKFNYTNYLNAVEILPPSFLESIEKARKKFTYGSKEHMIAQLSK